MSIANRITAMEEHLSNAYDGAKDLGVDLTSVNKNLNNIKSVLDTIYDEYPKVIETGTEVVLKETKSAKLSVDVAGNSTQIQYEGYNKLNNTATTQTINGVEFTVNDDGTILVNGTATNLINFIFYSLSGGLVGNKAYSLTGCPAGGNYSNGYSLSINAQGTLLDEGSGSVNTVPSEGRDISARIRIASGTVCNNLIFKPMIVEGSTEKTYEPYTNGLAVPNPSQKSDINNVTGNTVVKAYNKNLFDENTVTFIIGVLDDNGQPTSSVYSHYTENFYKVESNENYTLSGTIVEGTSSNRIYFYDENKNWISRTSASTSSTNTFTTPVNCKYIRIQVILAITLKTNDVQLEKGSTATPYTPYKENSVTFPLAQKQKLMLGDTLEANKICHKRKQIDKTFINSNITSVTEITDYVRIRINLGASNYSINTPNGLCNYFKFKADFSGQSNHFYAQNTSIYFIVSKTLLTSYDTAGAIAFFNTIPDIIAEYDLAEKTTEAYTTEQQTAYDNLKEMQSYYDLTYVSGTSDDAKPIITAYGLPTSSVITDILNDNY